MTNTLAWYPEEAVSTTFAFWTGYCKDQGRKSLFSYPHFSHLKSYCGGLLA